MNTRTRRIAVTVLFRARPCCAMGLLLGYPHGPLPLMATRPGYHGGGHLLDMFVFPFYSTYNAH